MGAGPEEEGGRPSEAACAQQAADPQRVLLGTQRFQISAPLPGFPWPGKGHGGEPDRGTPKEFQRRRDAGGKTQSQEADAGGGQGCSRGAQSEAPDPPIPRARARHRPQAGGHGLPPSEPPSYESRRFVAVKAKAHWRQGWSSLLRTEGAPTVLAFASVLPFSTVFPGRLPAASPSAPPFWTFPTMHREHVNVL